MSTAFRFTPYQLTLVPGAPTTFLRDGKPVKMTSRTVTVQVPGSGGTLQPVSRTLYSAPGYGSIFNSLEGVPLPWTPTTAFAMRDANADNFRVFNHFFDVDRAGSAPQVLSILKKYEGIPWVNTIVADKQGNALYADIGAIPNVTNAKAQQCDTPLGAATFTALGLPILDGSRSACDWGTDPDAIEPGLFGPSHLPHLFRSDYVTNSNDSYWLSNPHEPLTGFARIIGDEGTARSLRTRIGLIMTQARVDGSDGLGPRRIHPSGHAEPGLQRSPVRRGAGSKRPRLDVPFDAGWSGAHKLWTAGGGGERLRCARGLGPAREPELPRGDPVPPLLGSRHRGRAHPVVAPVQPLGSGAHSLRPRYQQPAGARRARRRHQRPRVSPPAARCRHRRRSSSPRGMGRRSRSTAAPATPTGSSTPSTTTGSPGRG